MNKYGVECYIKGNKDFTHYTKTITEAIRFAQARKHIGIYTARFITADEYGVKVDDLDDHQVNEIKAQEDQERREAIAARLDELIDPWEKEEDHLEEVLETLEADPLAIIEDLLTRIEDLEA